MQGMAFGAGSEVAHRAVGGLMGGHGQQAQGYDQGQGYEQAAPQQQSFDQCGRENQDFMSCLQSNSHDVGSCQAYLDIFKQCRQRF